MDRQKIDSRIARAPAGAAHRASVAATFGLAIEQAAARDPQAETLLAHIAFLAPEHIPLALLAAVIADDDERADALMPLAETSLIEHCSDENVPALTVHRLVQAAMRARLAERQSTILDQVTKLLVQAFPEGAYADTTVWLRCAELLPHVLALFKHCTAENVLPEAGGRLFHAAASYLHARDFFWQPSRSIGRPSG